MDARGRGRPSGPTAQDEERDEEKGEEKDEQKDRERDGEEGREMSDDATDPATEAFLAHRNLLPHRAFGRRSECFPPVASLRVI
ncbi:hypothetical protein [Streptomyces viridosporus]|uniref:hypothetical protein n=1 Tax=Streptomyces viridosporus TaxID=67581 RepID=UPI00333006AC